MSESKETDPSNETDPPKNDPSKNDPPKNDPPANDPPKDDDTDDKLRRLIREELGKAGGGRTSRMDMEERAEEMVRKAQERLAKDKEQEDRIAGIEQAVKAAETAPEHVRGITKAFWGDPMKKKGK